MNEAFICSHCQLPSGAVSLLSQYLAVSCDEDGDNVNAELFVRFKANGDPNIKNCGWRQGETDSTIDSSYTKRTAGYKSVDRHETCVE